jgi:hypothetical protein
MIRGAPRAITPARQAGLLGAWTSPGEWLRFPAFVRAPSPFDRLTPCVLEISHNDTRRAARAGRRQPAFDLWSMIIGCAPPVPGVDARNAPLPGALISIADAHACFRGIERPLAEDNDGGDVVAYALRPRFFYQYDPNMVSVALKVPVPRDVVFVVYARLFDANKVVASGPIGVITHWDFVEADRADPKLPVHHSSRYRNRLW